MTDEVGPWALEKLECLEKYLNAYTTIMRGQDWCEGFYYIDAFAGPGDHIIRSKSPESEITQLLIAASAFTTNSEEQRTFLTGSPRIALKLKYPFTRYVFVEKNPDRVLQLQQLKIEYGDDRAIVIRQEDCNEYLLTKVVNNSQINWKTSRAFVFLDPFGMQVPWSTIHALASTKAIEILLNFPVGMAIQRLLLRKPENYTTQQRAFLDEYFGSPEWFDVLYKKTKVRTLFHDEYEAYEKVERSGEALLQWYRSRLKSIFGYVSRASLIRNTKGGHLYYLLLASPKKVATQIANNILSAGELV